MGGAHTLDSFFPPSSSIVLERKKKPYVPQFSKKSLSIVALVNSRAYISKIDESDLERIKKQAPINNFRINDPPIFKHKWQTVSWRNK